MSANISSPAKFYVQIKNKGSILLRSATDLKKYLCISDGTVNCNVSDHPVVPVCYEMMSWLITNYNNIFCLIISTVKCVCLSVYLSLCLCLFVCVMCVALPIG